MGAIEQQHPIGEDPEAVAAAGLDACRRGRFAVVPDEWHAAVHERAASLTAGTPPAMPVPDDPTDAERAAP